MTDDRNRPEPTGASEAQPVELDEVLTNHLSPMGQVEDIGRFARGAGGDRLRRWVQWGSLGGIAVLIIALIV